VLAQIVERDRGMETMRLQTEPRSALEAKLELAEEVLFHSNRNIELTMQIIILGPEQTDHLLVKQAENNARIASLVQLIKDRVLSEEEKQLLDAASPRLVCSHTNWESLPQLTVAEGAEKTWASMVDVMLPVILDNTSWKAFVEFLRAQIEFVGLKEETNLEITKRTRELVRSNQYLKSIVAERKRVEERVSQLESIIEFSNDAIMIHTLGGTIVSWNPGAETIYGYSANEILGHSRYKLVAQDQLGEITEILKRIELGESIKLHETVNIRRDGKRINVSITISPVKDASGKIVGAATITREIDGRN
jgi:PAS domain S-box-containing protein